MKKNLLQRISINTDVMVGKPVVRGTRIPVELILKMMAQGIKKEDILKEYPVLKDKDIQAALAYAASLLANEDVFPIAVSG